MKITPPTSSQPPPHTPGYIGAITDRVKSDLVKQENEKSEKAVKPRKKRGQYKKTILRQQAEAAAAAAAAGLPPPQFPPLPESKRASHYAAQSTSNGKNRGGESSTTSTVESLEVRSHTPNHDHAASPTTLEMERELAMLAEEAEEDRRRREEEAADRILKRAQVVKHLRSLKSKLATAQIQIGHDLHYQSIDLFSQLYDEVLEDIGRDNNSELLNLLKNSARDQLNQDSDPESSEIAAHHSGHMLTRSSDKPRKKDLIPTTSRIPNGASRSHSSDHKSHVISLDVDSDNDSVLPRRNRRNKSSSQFVGQSWNIGSGRDESTSSSSSSKFNSRPRPNQRIIHAEEEEEEEEEEEDEEEPNFSSPRKSHGTTPSNLNLPSQTREELQFKHRRELEQLQSQQRKDQEEFQRKQLEQLRELQLRQNEEIEEFEEDKARRFKEHIEGLAEKRLKISQSLYSRKGKSTERARRKEPYSSALLSYEFENGFQSHSQDDSPSHSRSPSPSPPPQRLSRQTLDTQTSGQLLTSSPNRALSSRNASTSSPVQSTPKTHRINGSINPLPMSTMTLALTAMNEKKKQLKRAMKKQLEQEDALDNDVESSGQDEQQHSGTNGRRFLSPPIRSQKRSAPENATAFERSPSISNSSIAKPSTLPVLLQRQQSSNGHHLTSYHSPSQTSNDSPHSQLSHSHTQVGSPKLKKRKNPVSPPLGATAKGAIGFSKTLLSHFEKWNPDDKAGDFFDFVLSDPPDIDVGDAEVEDMLNGENNSTDQKDHHDLNATPTSNAFKWFQEQQKLAQELARQPKIAPLRLTDGDEDEGTGTEVSHDPMGAPQLGNEVYDGSGTSAELIPGEDPLAAFIQNKKKPHESRKHAAAATARIGDDEHEENSTLNDAKCNQTSQQIGNASSPSPFLPGSSGVLLYSEGSEGDWGFQPFSIDPTDEYLHNDAPLEGNKGYASLNF
ncbi:hypothetical protein BGZ79_009332 [Entomortierella chlamydospora]|nr:hypothetical protein BGZ79_009332 [Entomortierella chlamydospora]